MAWNIERISGSDLTGSTGATGRTYTLARSNVVPDSISVISADYPQTETDGYTYNSDTNTITFVKEVFDDYVIQIQYEYDTASVSSPSEDDLRYTTILDFNRYMLMAKPVPNRDSSTFPAKEEVGTGDDSETRFTFDNGSVIENSEVLYYGATETGATSTLTRDTHYSVDYDTGVITLTSAGVTLLSTNNIYATYDHNKYEVPNSSIKKALLSAELMVDNYTNTKFYDGTATTPEFGEVTNELLVGQGQFKKVYQTHNYPLNNASTTLDGAVSADDSTITVVSTQGFPSSGTIAIETDKVSYTGKTGTTFTGCTSVSAHDDGKTVRSYVIEQSVDDEGSTPTWEVLELDEDYSIDFDSGEIRLNDTSVAGTTILDNFHPPRGVWDRVRVSYQYGYNQIYNDIITVVHMLAGGQLFQGNVLNALARSSDGFDTNSFEGIQEKAYKLLQKYECWLIKDITS